MFVPHSALVTVAPHKEGKQSIFYIYSKKFSLKRIKTKMDRLKEVRKKDHRRGRKKERI